MSLYSPLGDHASVASRNTPEREQRKGRAAHCGLLVFNIQLLPHSSPSLSTPFPTLFLTFLSALAPSPLSAPLSSSLPFPQFPFLLLPCFLPYLRVSFQVDNSIKLEWQCIQEEGVPVAVDTPFCLTDQTTFMTVVGKHKPRWGGGRVG